MTPTTPLPHLAQTNLSTDRLEGFLGDLRSRGLIEERAPAVAD
jgi:hypothetical protein